MPVTTQSKEEIQKEQDADPAGAFLNILNRATPQQLEMIKSKMGVTDNSIKLRRDRKRKINNERARQLVMTDGEVIHNDPNWRPIPPEAVVQKGQLAQDIWYQKWEEGLNMSSRELADAEAMADEAEAHTAEMERRVDAGEFSETNL